MAGVLQVTTVELARIIHDEHFGDAIRTPVIPDTRILLPNIGFGSYGVLQTLHNCKVAWRVEADIKADDHLGINTDHPGENGTANRQHHDWIDNEKVSDRVIALDSFQWPGWTRTLKYCAIPDTNPPG